MKVTLATEARGAFRCCVAFHAPQPINPRVGQLVPPRALRNVTDRYSARHGGSVVQRRITVNTPCSDAGEYAVQVANLCHAINFLAAAMYHS